MTGAQDLYIVGAGYLGYVTVLKRPLRSCGDSATWVCSLYHGHHRARWRTRERRKLRDRIYGPQTLRTFLLPGFQHYLSDRSL